MFRTVCSKVAQSVVLIAFTTLSGGTLSGFCQDATSVLGPSDKEAAKAEALFEKGHRALDKRDVKGAEECYRKAIELNPSESRYHRQLSLILLTMRRGQQAEREALYAAKLDPQDWKSVLVLGQVYHHENRLDEEVSTYKKVLEALPAEDKSTAEEKAVRQKIVDFIKRDEIAVKNAEERARKKKEWEEKEFKNAY